MQQIEKPKKVGICLNCGKEFVFTSTHQKFCSNSKTLSHGNCKDEYWNNKSKKEFIKTKRLENPTYCNKK